ncbi:MAG: amino acid adenylation domain-containing protein [Chloroflexi bacterium]|nr:amino acid adenylation domain-containing protein [Chloroflexota bacterium]
MAYLLPQLLAQSAARAPEAIALRADGAQLTYGELEARSNQLARALAAEGVRRGDRVGIYLRKSPAAVIGIYAALKLGAVYVPIDPAAPGPRAGYIIGNCGIRALVTTSDRLGRLRQGVPEGATLDALMVADWDGRRELAAPAGARLVAWDTALSAHSAEPFDSGAIDTDLAYILYTSGSTGEPKGVMLSHRNALTFVEWCLARFGVGPDDRLTSHAPFHFDLSVFDLYVAAAAGATLVLISEEAKLFARPQAELIRDERISVWYSVPSALVLLLTQLDLREYAASLRLVLFAGEVFPTKYLRQLRAAVPQARLFNLYGPTETNVCTYYEVRDLPPERTEPIPIGRACENTEVFALDEQGRLCGVGEVGELYCRGSTVMQGYWGRPEDTARVLIQNPLQPHFRDPVYRTGDLVRLNPDGDYEFLGRRDNQIKSRGFRIELGEIETALYNHPAVREAVAYAVPDEQITNRIYAAVALHAGATVTPAELERHCIAALPRYMVPERIVVQPALPKTSTGKLDRRALQAQALGAATEGRS